MRWTAATRLAGVLSLFASLSVCLPAAGSDARGLSQDQPFRLPGGVGEAWRPSGGPGRELQLSAQFEVEKGGRDGRLHVKASLAPDWRVYSLTQQPPPQKSELAVQPSQAFQITGPFQPDRDPEIRRDDVFDVPLEEHCGEVTWTAPLRLAPGADPASLKIDVTFNGQVCNAQSCVPIDNRKAEARFAGHYEPPGPGGEHRAERSHAATGGQVEPAAVCPSQTANTAARAAAARSAAKAQPGGGGFENNPIPVILGLAFVAGLILNVMPCVLPVIGLKIMSFIQQAGESRIRVLLLNVWYCLGLLSVFLVLATTAFFLHWGWGEQFSSAGFSITMAAIVFVFGLSLLGVWEMPIPGFVGSGRAGDLAEREGALGAFSKGVLTTILATPCTGPFLGSAVGWAIKQPAWLNYATFACVGLGMASPYLLIGAFPRLIRGLPKPGAWMETFKQLMGFVLMGTVVFIFYFLDEDYTVQTLALLVALAAACWMAGRTPLTASSRRRVLAWSGGGFVAAASALLIFVVAPWMVSLVIRELPWQPYSRVVLEENLQQGRTVLVDFTADW